MNRLRFDARARQRDPELLPHARACLRHLGHSKPEKSDARRAGARQDPRPQGQPGSGGDLGAVVVRAWRLSGNPHEPSRASLCWGAWAGGRAVTLRTAAPVARARPSGARAAAGARGRAWRGGERRICESLRPRPIASARHRAHTSRRRHGTHERAATPIGVAGASGVLHRRRGRRARADHRGPAASGARSDRGAGRGRLLCGDGNGSTEPRSI